MPDQTLLKTNAHVYIIHGTADKNSSIASADLLVSELATKNRPFIYKRLLGLDHRFSKKGEDQMDQVISDSVKWALETP